jgi:myo-inositol-1(or 4)-monophosphatase
MKQIALQAALEGGRVLMHKFGSSLSVVQKGEIDLQTDADRAAEEAIVSVIRGTFPRHDILAEEKDYSNVGSSYRWIIDPLDGTTNFAHAFPWFAVSIALEVDGEIVLGTVYNPISHEMFFAEKGKGAFLNEIELRVSKTDRLNRALLATGFPYDRKESRVNNYDHFINFQQRAQACRRPGAASLDLVYTAAGRLDGYWEMKLNPWDVAAGKLIVEEAGGKTTDFSGRPMDIFGQEYLASNGLIHQAMIDVLNLGLKP